MKAKYTTQLLCLGLAAVSAFLVTGCTNSRGLLAGMPQPDEQFLADAENKEVNAALQVIKAMPDSATGYTQLSAVYVRLARETGNADYSKKAETSIDLALQIEPSGIPARKLKASILLTFHRFSEGLQMGKELQAELPNDAFVYGILTDANAELGNYEEAVTAAQRMVDLKPNASSYARVGHIRSLHGNMKGAIESLTLAARMTDPQDREGQSWCLVQIGNEYWKNGRYAQAEKAYDEALQNFPNYYLALAGKGRVLASTNRLDEAARFLTAAQERHLNLDTIFLLGDVYTKLGESGRANEQYELAQGGEARLGTANDPHRVALFWANRNENLDEALAVAEQDYATQRDIYASDTLAWCLYKKGRFDEAKRLADEAMRTGADDAKILYHAGMIEKAMGNQTQAARLLGRAMKLNPSFDLIQSDDARAALVSLTTGRQS